MERLKLRDLHALLGCLRDVYGVRDPATFSSDVVRAVRRVVPRAISTYNEIDRQACRVAWRTEPPDATPLSTDAVFGRFMHEHPFIAYRQWTRDDSALAFSDFLSRRELRRLAVYNEFYRPVDVEYQTSIPVRIGPPLAVTIALNRDCRDFSRRDRLVLELLGPHLAQAYRNAAALTKVQRQLALVRAGVEHAGCAIVTLSAKGAVRWATAAARRWLASYFPDRRRASQLPDALRRWVEEQEALLPDAASALPPRALLVVERGERRLVIGFLSEPDGTMLVLKEQGGPLDPASLERIGLTRREAEVLAWVAAGKTNAEVAAILGIRARTVGKHLERAFPKLGVETRTAAAARAREVVARWSGA